MIDVFQPREAIEERIAALAKEIRADCAGSPHPLTVLAVLNGGLFFAADLIRALDMPDLQYDTISLESYQGTVSRGTIRIRSTPKTDLRGRTALIVDDILDTGLTLRKAAEYIRGMGAAEVRTCVLLNKQLHDPAAKKFRADWVGFDMPPFFVVGYGLDYNEKYRALPYLGHLREPDIPTTGTPQKLRGEKGQ